MHKSELLRHCAICLRYVEHEPGEREPDNCSTWSCNDGGSPGDRGWTFEDIAPGNPQDSWEEKRWNGDNLIRAKEDVPCSTCGAPARWLSISFEAGFCSPACLDKMWDEFAEACAKIPEDTAYDFD